MDYAVRMVATAQTYEYHIIEFHGLDINRKATLTFKEVHGLAPTEVKNNVLALVYVQEHAKEILDNFQN